MSVAFYWCLMVPTGIGGCLWVTSGVCECLWVSEDAFWYLMVCSSV